MPQITMPSSVSDRLSDMDIHITNPNQRIHRSEFTGTISILYTGYPRWTGQFTAGPWNEYEIDVADEAGAFFDSLNGYSNWFELPLGNRSTVASGVTGTIASRRVNSAGHLEHSLSAAMTDLRVGMFLRTSTNEVVRVRSINGVRLVFDPQRPLATSVTLSAATSIRVTSNTTESPPQIHIPLGGYDTITVGFIEFRPG